MPFKNHLDQSCQKSTPENDESINSCERAATVFKVGTYAQVRKQMVIIIIITMTTTLFKKEHSSIIGKQIKRFGHFMTTPYLLNDIVFMRGATLQPSYYHFATLFPYCILISIFIFSGSRKTVSTGRSIYGRPSNSRSSYGIHSRIASNKVSWKLCYKL